MDDVIAAILGYLSSWYSRKKISKLILASAAGISFFCGYFLLEIFHYIHGDKTIDHLLIPELIKDLSIFSGIVFSACYIGLFLIESVEKYKSRKK